MCDAKAFVVVRREVVVNFYDRWILPLILDLVMRQNQLEKYRREVVASANGRVLEVGVGSGLNFPLYGKQVEIVVGIDPSPRLLAIARRRVAAAGVRLLITARVGNRDPSCGQHGGHGGNDLDALFDRRPAGRVTRDAASPQGERQVTFCRTWACARTVERWQRRLTPVWCHIAGVVREEFPSR